MFIYLPMKLLFFVLVLVFFLLWLGKKISFGRRNRVVCIVPYSWQWVGSIESIRIWHRFLLFIRRVFYSVGSRLDKSTFASVYTHNSRFQWRLLMLSLLDSQEIKAEIQWNNGWQFRFAFVFTQSLESIRSQSIECDTTHTHRPWDQYIYFFFNSRLV